MCRQRAKRGAARAVLPPGLLLLVLAAAWAPAAGPENEEIVIRAQTATLNQARGVGLYEGDAELRQGNRSLSADMIRIELKEGAPGRIEATGDPVRLREGNILDARGDRLVYDVQEKRIQIFGDARVDHQGRVFEGAELEYNLTTRQVNASGGDTGRVRMVIPAEETEKQ